MPDWNLECEIKIRALEALKENLGKEIDELINIAKKVQQEHLARTFRSHRGATKSK